MARLIPNTWHDTQLLDADNGRIVASAATPTERDEIARRYNTHDELVSALRGLLDVLNADDDGDWFICREASPTIEAARAVLAKLDA